MFSGLKFLELNIIFKYYRYTVVLINIDINIIRKNNSLKY